MFFLSDPTRIIKVKTIVLPDSSRELHRSLYRCIACNAISAECHDRIEGDENELSDIPFQKRRLEQYH